MAASSQDRLGFIEGMRGFAALYVAFQHCCTLVDPNWTVFRPGFHPAWLSSLMGLCQYGHFAVSGFIVISGFCLQMSLHQRGDGRVQDLKRFFARRCERILPPYYACLALSLLTCWAITSRQTGAPWDQYVPVTADRFWSHVFLIHNLNKDWMYGINGVLWSISIEFQLYFVFPLAAWLLWKYGGRLTIPLALVGAFILMFSLPDGKKLYFWYAPLFVIGMAAARLAFEPQQRSWLEKRLPSIGWTALVFILFAFWVVTLAAQNWTLVLPNGATLLIRGKEVWLRDLPFGVGIALSLAYGVMKANSPITKTFGWKPLVKLGGFSYSLYLVHHLILQAVFVTRPESFNTTLRAVAYMFAVGIPMVLAGSYAFFLVFERPFLNGYWTKKKFRKEHPLGDSAA